ncbi:aminoglycoside adenylyltransferase domain-containing protein [Bacillus sp. FJAT-49736]|uniref:aminoglycoside adenylyltransferase domain-containing protein n=1 Tax=Bacillus sp. FJAT-49736 TaxID=2833582 RepID=UPI001BC9CBAA|nr:aminoglycoside adenylyltransferase domain-containing protein [Bacillus sp. FJAT-49736]MBS4172840.1 DUF4111 domain-containing protein [Bacillus sp. FJAT-49736]
MSVELFLHDVCAIFKRNLREKLVGVYLHGSLAMGCFHPEKSDVDVLVVIREKLVREEKNKLIQEILQLQGFRLEMSIILEKEVQEFQYPTPFELHYSEMHKERYLQDKDYLCSDGLDPDLAAHLVITYERGVCLYGKPVRVVFNPIDISYYRESILYDISNAVEEIMHNPVYYTLNLCRVLYYLKEGIISSKKEGGEWGMENVPAFYRRLVKTCLFQYIEPDEHVTWDEEMLIGFAEYMVNEIQIEVNSIHKENGNNGIG